MKLTDITTLIGGTIISPNEDIVIKGVSTLENASKTDIVFLFRTVPKTITTKSKLLVVSSKLNNTLITQIVVPNPRIAMATLLNQLYPNSSSPINPNKQHTVIHPTANIHPQAQIGPFTTIGENTKIGKNSIIKSNVSIGSNCTIGANCNIHPNVSIYNGTIIGNNVTIQSSTVIGSSGFGYEKHQGKWVKIPHIGIVKIGNNVEIGANTCIDRGGLGNTIISNGVKIDNLIQIAHNCIIGEHTIIAGGVLIAGSVTIDSNCIIAGDVSFNDGITIGKNTTILANSKVTKNIQPNQIVSGFPAINHREELRFKSFLRKLFKTNN